MTIISNQQIAHDLAIAKVTKDENITPQESFEKYHKYFDEFFKCGNEEKITLAKCNAIKSPF